MVSTKLYWGIDREGVTVNFQNTLNRKYLMQAIDGSPCAWAWIFVDLVYCHRPDPNTPIEETVWAMHDMISQGQSLVLGHQRMVGRRNPRGLEHCRAPPPAQARGGTTQYHLFHRKRVEQEYARLYEDIGLG